MNITHTWIIKKLRQINNGNGIVTRIDYKVVSRDEDTSTATSYPDFVQLETENIDMENFIPYNELTEEKVIQFGKDKLKHGVEMIENGNAREIQNKINPPTPSAITENLPWS